MGFREHVRENRLAISACCVSLLCGAALLTRSWRDSPTPRPVVPPRPPVAPGGRPPAPPLKLAHAAVAADASAGVGGLKTPRLIRDPARGRVIAYFDAEDPADPVERLRAGLQRAWAALRPQLPRGEPTTTAHLVVLRSPATYAGEPPAANDPAVITHGVVTRAAVDRDWPETISEWR